MDARAPQGFDEVRTGLLVLAAIGAVAGTIFFLDVVQRAFMEGPTLVVVAEEVEGLEEGAVAWVAGSPAGRVTDMSFLPPDRSGAGRVAIAVVLLRGAAPALRRDADVRIGRGALLSPSVVKLDPGSPGAPPYDFRDSLRATPVPGLAEFQALGDTARTAADSLRAALAELERLTREGHGTVPRLRRDPGRAELLVRQRATRGRLVRALEESALPEFAADTSLRESARRTRERLVALAADSTAREGRRRLVAAIGPLSARLARLGARLDAAEGTLGRMAADGELRIQIDATRARLDSLRLDAAARPLRYLRLRLF